MGKDHRGQPSGTNKTESNTGIPSQIVPGKMGRNQEMTDKYTQDDQNIADNVRTEHPNRNTSKGKSTGAGGYKNGVGS